MSPASSPSASPKSAAPKSMTGYAQAHIEQNGWSLRVSVRSVNHRFLDLHLHLPEGFEPFEPRMRQLLRERVRRGHIDVTLHFEPAGPAAVQVNREVAEAYLRIAEDLRRQFGMKTEPDLMALLRLPGVIAASGTLGETGSEDEQERLATEVAACLEEALTRLDEMRRAEGRLLAEEMSGRLVHIAEKGAQIRALAEQSRPAYARRLEMRLKELLGTLNSSRHACSKKQRCWPSTATSAKRLRASRATSTNSKSCFPLPEKRARNSISCCRKCSARPTPCCRRRRESKPKGWPSRTWRWRSSPRSRNSANRRRTSNSDAGSETTAGVHRLRAFGVWQVHFSAETSGIARHDAIRFVHYA